MLSGSILCRQDSQNPRERERESTSCDSILYLVATAIKYNINVLACWTC